MSHVQSKSSVDHRCFGPTSVRGVARAFDPFSYSTDLNLSNEDGRLVHNAAQKLCTKTRAKVGDRETWFNPVSGNSGTVTLMAIYTWSGMPCRSIQYDFVVKTRRDPHSVQFDSCRTTAGEWKIR